MKTYVDVSGVDWAALRTQKATLEQMISICASAPRADDMRGILHLIDHVQDQAAENLGAAAVFGDRAS